MGLFGDAAGAAVIYVLVCNNPAAAMKVDNHRKGAAAVRGVNAHRQGTCRAGDCPVSAGHARRHQRGRRRVLALLFEDTHHRIGWRGLLARLAWGERLNGLAFQGRQGVQHLLHVRVGLVFRARA